MNRLLTYLLHRCGAFSTSVLDLHTCVRSQRIDADAVICRHGADTKEHLRTIIVDYDLVRVRFDEMRAEQCQQPVRFWRPGAFPVFQQGGQR